MYGLLKCEIIVLNTPVLLETDYSASVSLCSSVSESVGCLDFVTFPALSFLLGVATGLMVEAVCSSETLAQPEC
jgi:hypothetical protein